MTKTTKSNAFPSASRKPWLQAGIVAMLAALLVAPLLPTASASLGDTGCFAIQATNKDGGQVGQFHGPGCGPVADGEGGSVVVPAPTPTPTPTPTTAPVPIASGTVSFSSTTYRGVESGGRVDFPTLTGFVKVSSGSLPSRVYINFSDPRGEVVDLQRDAGPYAAVDPITGEFSVDGVYNAIVGGENPFGYAYAGVAPDDANGVDFAPATTELTG